MRRVHALAPAFALGLLAGAVPAFATDWVAYYHQKVAEFKAANAQLDPKKKNVVLVGDSITEGFSATRVAADMPGVKDLVINRGISSDGVGVNDRGVLHRLDESVFDTHPGQIVLNIGVNDLDPTRPAASVEAAAKKLREVVTKIQDKLPGVPIVLELSSPTRGKHDGLNPLLDSYREKERALAQELGLKTIDLKALLGGADGKIKPELTSDGLHWSDAAYKIVGKALEEALAAPAPKPGNAVPAKPGKAPSPSPADPPKKAETRALEVPDPDAPSETSGFVGALPGN